MIRITRTARFIDALVAYKIYIDGIYRGKIKRGETKEFEVENGSHTVYASTGPYGSNTLRIYVSDSIVEYVSDSIVDIEVRNALRGWNLWLGPFAEGNFAKNEYLILTVLQREK